MARKNDKRVRLVEAADKLFHEKGFNLTTLANIAELADVPLGNVYYYFKSKESIALAVIERRSKCFNNLSAEWDSTYQGIDRLKAFIKHSVAYAEERAKYGDSIGSLCQELGKQGGCLAQSASQLMHTIVDWVEAQFKNMNKGDSSEHLAATLVSTLQGLSLLTVTFKDPEYLARQTEYLNTWLEMI